MQFWLNIVIGWTLLYALDATSLYLYSINLKAAQLVILTSKIYNPVYNRMRTTMKQYFPAVNDCIVVINNI